MAITIKEMPEHVVDWLYSGERALLVHDYVRGLSDAEKDAVQAAVLGAYRRESNLREAIESIKRVVPGEQGSVLVRAVLGADCSRAADWFSESPEALLLEAGGDPAEYKQLLDGEEAIGDALRGVNVELIPPRTREAVTTRMLEYLNGEIQKADLLEAMMKSPKIGGWGWDQDTAVPVIEKLEAHIREAQERHAVFVSKAKKAEIEVKRAKARDVMGQEVARGASAEPQQNDAPQSIIVSEAKDHVAAPVVVPSELPPPPDPFAFVVQENLPHLADAELNLPPMRDPFADLLEELAQGKVPQPAYAYADVHEHRGVAEASAPATPFEQALHASDVLLENELREIEHRKEELMKSVPETAIVVSTTLEALVDRIMADSKFTSSDASLMRRIRNIISSRLRDIRGSEETAKLITKIGQGSRDLPREMVERIVMLTEQAFLEFQRKVIERGLQRERARRVRDREEVLERKREEIFNTEKELNERFKKLTGKEMPLELAGTEPQPALPQASEAPERKVMVKLSAPSVPPAAPMAAPVTDVKYQRQLAGPIEELRTMRLTDFRRLSKDPRAATEKVMAKIELLGAEGYDKKVLGSVAWRESPIMKLYLAVTKQALDEATQLVSVLERKRKEIPEMLTIEECQAIRELNTKLRY